MVAFSIVKGDQKLFEKHFSYRSRKTNPKANNFSYIAKFLLLRMMAIEFLDMSEKKMCSSEIFPNRIEKIFWSLIV